MFNIFFPGRLKGVKLQPAGVVKATAGRDKRNSLLPSQTSMVPANVVFDVAVAEFQRNVNGCYSTSPRNDAGLQLSIRSMELRDT